MDNNLDNNRDTEEHRFFNLGIVTGLADPVWNRQTEDANQFLNGLAVDANQFPA